MPTTRLHQELDLTECSGQGDFKNPVPSHQRLASLLQVDQHGLAGKDLVGPHDRARVPSAVPVDEALGVVVVVKVWELAYQEVLNEHIVEREAFEV